LAFFRRAESVAVLRRHWKRLLVCGVLMVPGYNLALYYGQQHGVSAPVASLTTALVPLYVMILAAIFLGEHLTTRRMVGFAVAATGMGLISLARTAEGGGTYPLLVAITALAPLCWSLYSVISKPMSGRISPIVWAYLGTGLGAVLVLPLLPGSTWQQWAALDGPGWVALFYLSIPCTVLGFAVWTWLLRHLPASSVGFTVFLNPPLTTLSKYVLALLAPAAFAFSIAGQEWLGGALTLLGLGIAVYTRRRG
jgi:drug/metabolite transporter (DMT)-like permease